MRRNEILQPLNHAIEDWLRNDHEFHCARVENKKLLFVRALKEFIDELSLHIAMDRNSRISIGLHETDGRGHENKLKIAKKLNNLSSTAYRNFDVFFKKSNGIFDL